MAPSLHSGATKGLRVINSIYTWALKFNFLDYGHVIVSLLLLITTEQFGNLVVINSSVW